MINGMTPDAVHLSPTISPEVCYRAMQARDARFDGCFFTAVTSTGIYCRPVCKVRLPKLENCRFFGHAAQAEQAGFRPCLRCRPELAPHSVVWSIQDASYILAHQAARWLDEPDAWLDGSPSIERLAAHLGVSDRHVRRIFEAQFGVSPLQYLQTRRLLTAKQLLADTDLPITQVALVSGFGSVRRFNAAFAEHYGLNPTQLRRNTPQAPTLPGQHPGQAASPSPGATVRLGYRPPYDVPAMLAFLGKRSLSAMESVANSGDEPWARRTFRVESGGHTHLGWVQASFDTARCQVSLSISPSLREVLPLVIRRARAWLDLDADPKAINAVLGGAFPGLDGLRVPGCLDGYELAVRAILGQQITVAAGRTLTQRLLDRFGTPLATPWPGLDRVFPAAAVLAQAEGDALGQLGIVKQRQAAIVALARAVAEGRMALHAGVDVHATVTALKTLPGIGDWTAQYIAMRALRWPDAFPAGDVALHKALGVQGSRKAAVEAEALSQAWKPWRSYAVLRAWAAGAVAAPDGAAKTTNSIANSP